LKLKKVNFENSKSYYDRLIFIVSYFWIFGSDQDLVNYLKSLSKQSFELCIKISYLQSFNPKIFLEDFYIEWL
jgi:hypothetical protein